MPKLVYLPGTPDQKVFPLAEGTISIGRTQENSVFIAHKSISRRHAELEYNRARNVLILRDLQSKNGTFVNNAAITEQTVRPGDAIRLGDLAFALMSDEEPPPTRPMHRGSQVPAQPAPPGENFSAPTLVMEVKTQAGQEALQALLGRGNGALRVRTDNAERRANDKLQILLQVAQVLSSPEPLENVLRSVLDLAFQILDVNRAAILLLDANTGRLEPRVTRTARPDEQGPLYSQRIVDYVRESGQAALFSDAALDPRLNASKSVVAQSIRASMCVPLKRKDSLLGVLYLDNQSIANRFSQEDLEFVAAFANQAAFAIENAQLYQRIERDAALRNSLLRFFPPTTAKKLMEAPGASLGAMETEVTSIFSDISAFTSMSSTMEPRDVVALLNEYFPVMSEVVFRYEGTIEKYIGDALMAIWGAPFPHPDDADRAVLAAIEMQRALLRLNAHWQAQGRRTIDIHIGINTGRVAVGNIGSEQYLQYAAIGDATNVSSRVCSAAKEGEILLSEATRVRLKNNYPLETLPPIAVKGKDLPLQLYRLHWR